MPTSRTRTINRVLWTAQLLTALLFLFAGSMKFIMSPAQMQQGGLSLPIPFIHFVGVCECLGALGLVLPGATHNRTFLTPLAAAGLTIIMIGAVVVSVLAMGVSAAVFPGVVGVVTTWIAYGRTRVAPLDRTSRNSLRAA